MAVGCVADVVEETSAPICRIKISREIKVLKEDHPTNPKAGGNFHFVQNITGCYYLLLSVLQPLLSFYEFQ